MTDHNTHPPLAADVHLTAVGRQKPRSGHPSPVTEPAGAVTIHSTWWRTPPQETVEARVLRHHGAEARLVDRLARLDSLLDALESRPDDEGPLEACLALVDRPEARQLVPGPDDLQIVALLTDHPSLGGHFFWRMQAASARMAVEFARRMDVPHTDLRPQLLAASVMAGLNAALVTWLSNPTGPTADELARQTLAHLAEGLADPASPPGNP